MCSRRDPEWSAAQIASDVGRGRERQAASGKRRVANGGEWRVASGGAPNSAVEQGGTRGGGVAETDLVRDDRRVVIATRRPRRLCICPIGLLSLLLESGHGVADRARVHARPALPDRFARHTVVQRHLSVLIPACDLVHLLLSQIVHDLHGSVRFLLVRPLRRGEGVGCVELVESVMLALVVLAVLAG